METPRETADCYQDFFYFMIKEHGVQLFINQMDEIIYEAQKVLGRLEYCRKYGINNINNLYPNIKIQEH